MCSARCFLLGCFFFHSPSIHKLSSYQEESSHDSPPWRSLPFLVGARLVHGAKKTLHVLRVWGSVKLDVLGVRIGSACMSNRNSVFFVSTHLLFMLLPWPFPFLHDPLHVPCLPLPLSPLPFPTFPEGVRLHRTWPCESGHWKIWRLLK